MLHSYITQEEKKLSLPVYKYALDNKIITTRSSLEDYTRLNQYNLYKSIVGYLIKKNNIKVLSVSRSYGTIWVNNGYKYSSSWNGYNNSLFTKFKKMYNDIYNTDDIDRKLNALPTVEKRLIQQYRNFLHEHFQTIIVDHYIFRLSMPYNRPIISFDEINFMERYFRFLSDVINNFK